MSSTTFSVELHPDPRLRRLVLGSGAVLFAIGFSVIVSLGIAVSGRAVLGLVWVPVICRQWLSFYRAYARNGVLRVDSSGVVRCRQDGGYWEPLEIRPGSVVLARWAWLRLGQADAPDYAELLYGEARQNEDWRRFQVIWRHIGAVP